MLAPQVQTDRGLFKVTMPKQNLDRAQISSGFQQMRREAVTQGVRMDVLMLQASANRGLPASRPQHLGRDWTARGMPA